MSRSRAGRPPWVAARGVASGVSARLVSEQLCLELSEALDRPGAVLGSHAPDHDRETEPDPLEPPMGAPTGS